MSRGFTRLVIENATGSRTFTLSWTELNDLTPGQTFFVSFSSSSTGAAPPQAPTDPIQVTMKSPNGSQIRRATYPAGASSTGTQFAVTDSGAGGGSGRAGTYELDLRVISTGGIAPYDVSSDNRGTQTTSGLTITRERGWGRATTDVEFTLGKDSSLTQVDPFAYGDQVYGKVETAVPLFGSQIVTVAMSREDTAVVLLSSSSFLISHNGSTATALLGTVGSSLPAERVETIIQYQFANAAVSGAAGLVPATAWDIGSPAVDARVTITRHMQANNNTFERALNVENARRLTSELCFLNSRFTNARDEGINSVSVTRHLYDADQLVATPTSGVQASTSTTLSTTTADGEDGWLPVGAGQMIAWDEALPGGTWYVRHTSSTFGKQLTYDGVSGTSVDVPYSLIAADPNLILITAGGPGHPLIDTRHFSPGDPYVAGVAIFNTNTNEMISADVDSPSVLVARFNLALGQAEILQADGVTWLAGHTGNDYYHPCAETFPGSKVYTLMFPAEQTATWGASDTFIIGKATVQGVPVSSPAKEIVVSGINNHNGYVFDGAGFVGFPSK